MRRGRERGHHSISRMSLSTHVQVRSRGVFPSGALDVGWKGPAKRLQLFVLLAVQQEHGNEFLAFHVRVNVIPVVDSWNAGGLDLV